MSTHGCCRGSIQTNLGREEELDHSAGYVTEPGYLLVTMQEVACAWRMEEVESVEGARADLYGN